MADKPDFDYSGSPVQLLNIGVPATPWPDYPALYGLTAEDIPELIRMASDADIWEEDPESPAIYRNIHAWRALAQLHAVEALPDLVRLLRWVDEYDDDWTGEDLPEAIGLIGPAAIPLLADYLADPQHGEWARVAAASSLAEIGIRHPASRPESAAAITRTLAAYVENSDILNAELITFLADLEQPNTYPLVEQVFQSGRVDKMVMGDWEDFQIRVGLLEERLTERNYNFGFSSFPTGLSSLEPKRSGGKEDKKAKAKRKMEKQSRKKNRKKKK